MMALRFKKNKNISVLLVAICVLFATTSARAFIYIRAGVYANKGERPVSRAPVWGARTATFVINSDQTAMGVGTIVPELTSAEFISAVTQAVQAWAAACDSDIQVVYGGTTNVTKNSADGVNAIVWDHRTGGEGNVINSTGVLASAYSAVNSTTDVYSDCDIVVNGESVGDHGVNGEGAKYDLVATLTHEIGHCLGLDHTIELPTWTSTNSILLNATMKSTISAGDIEGRTISQDEKDGLACSTPTDKSFRSGSRCTSYHGTNGNGGLSGTVSGGPTDEPRCGAGTSSSVKTEVGGETGGGCVTRAIASDGSGTRGPTLGSSWLVEFTVILGAFLTLRFLRSRFTRARAHRTRTGAFWVFAIVFGGSSLLTTQAHALSFEAGAEYRWANPKLLNKATELTTQEGTFAKINPKETYRQSYDPVVRVMLNPLVGATLQLGAFGRTVGEGERVQTGLSSSNEVLMTKTTNVSGYSGGPTVRLNLPAFTMGLSLFFEALIGLGRVSMTQSIKGTTSSDLSELDASAFSFESAGMTGLNIEVVPFFHVRIYGGYSRYKTNALSINSVKGSRYDNASAGKRLKVYDGAELVDLIIDRTGYVGGAALMLVF